MPILKEQSFEWRKLACVGLIGICACASAPVVEPPPPTPSTAATVEPSPSDLPSAKALFEKSIAALGGRARLQSIQSLVVEGSMSVPAQGIEATVSIYQQAPNRMLMRMTIPGFGEVVEGFDGEVAWSQDPMTGPRLKEDDELADTRRRADIHAVLHYADHYASLETLGRIDFQGIEVFDVLLSTPEGKEEHAYFDVASGLRIGTSAALATDMGDVHVVAKYSRFESVGGALQPMRIEQKQGPTLSIIEVTSVRENVEELPSFEPPPQIKALVDAREE